MGLGRIGRTAADPFLRLGFAVRGYDVAQLPAGADVDVTDSLEELLETSDLVTLHVPGNPDGTPLLTAEHLRHMHTGSALVGLVDVEALALALNRGKPKFAALDVFPTEPPHLDVFAPVRDQVLMTPHMAWYTEETEIRLRRGAAAEVLRLLSANRPSTWWSANRTGPDATGGRRRRRAVTGDHRCSETPSFHIPSRRRTVFS